MRFVHHTLAQRVRFGTGAASEMLAAEIAELGVERVMVIAASAEADLAHKVSAALPVALHHNEVAMHVPAELADRARDAADTASVDAILSVGGGSTTGLAKAIALTSGLPIVALPTTYAGSEATNVWGLTEAGRKTTGVDMRVLPKAVVYDASLTLTLPPEMSVSSGLNALAHCVDSLWAPRRDPINSALAGEGIRALRRGLSAIVEDPLNLTGREEMLYATYLSGVAFASAGSGLHHKICHVLGGRYDLPHAETHAVVLPYVLAVNAPVCPEAAGIIATALDARDGLSALMDLRAHVGAPEALSSLPSHGLTFDDLPYAAEAILEAMPPSNPAALSLSHLQRLLEAAYSGTDPRELATIVF